MFVIPAIDLKGGRCVRLVQGLEDSAKVYDGDPVQVARDYLRAGVARIHVVDLDGAFLGATSENQVIVRRIVSELGAPVEVGGGVRSLSDIERLLTKVGARFVIVGTLAVERPEVLKEAVAEFRDSVIVGIDARGSRVATHGWTESTQVDALELARQSAGLGAQRIIYTDITRDGTLQGPNYEMTQSIARESGLLVTASGGVASLGDIARMRQLEPDGVDSIVIGKALYEARFTVEEAIRVAKAGVT